MTEVVARPLPASQDDALAEFARLLAERNRQLEHALSSRVVIEQAKGMLAERYSLSVDESFELLRRAARSNRLRIHDLADRVLRSEETPVEVLALLQEPPHREHQRVAAGAGNNLHRRR
jgi:hypothetical protein